MSLREAILYITQDMERDVDNDRWSSEDHVEFVNYISDLRIALIAAIMAADPPAQVQGDSHGTTRGSQLDSKSDGGGST